MLKLLCPYCDKLYVRAKDLKFHVTKKHINIMYNVRKSADLLNGTKTKFTKEELIMAALCYLPSSTNKNNKYIREKAYKIIKENCIEKEIKKVVL